MDRRQLFVLFAMTLSFLFINNYFFAPKLQQQATQDVANVQQIGIEDIPTTELFYDIEGKKFACYGVRVGEGIITLPSKIKSPKSLFTGGKEFFCIQGGKQGTPTLYGENQNIRALSKTLGALPSEISLITNLDQQGELKGLTAKSSENQIEFAGDPPLERALAIAATPEGWSFVGYWSEKSETLHTISDLKGWQSFIQLTEDSPSVPRDDEKLYVLENDYAQFVFSNLGGAISEVNLSLKAPDSEMKDKIHAGRFDHLIQESSPNNNLYPIFSYFTSSEDGKMTRHTPKQGGYTPLLRRNLKEADGSIKKPLHPSHYALNLISKGPLKEPQVFKVTSMSQDSITFEGEEGGRKMVKTFKILQDAPYTLGMRVKVDGDARNLWLTSGIPEVELIAKADSPTLQYLPANTSKSKVSMIKLPKALEMEHKIDAAWTASTNGFFGLITNPLFHAHGEKSALATRISGSQIPTRLSMIDPQHNPYPAEDYPGYEFLTPYEATPKALDFYFFAGPLDNNILKKVDGAIMSLSSGFDPSFASAVTNSGGWFTSISAPLAKILFLGLQFFHFLTSSWGISIILLTIAFRFLLYPLNAMSFRSMTKTQKVAPKLKAIQEKYKKDPKRMQMETAMLYKNEGIGLFSVFLPMLAQFPFFLGMYELLKTAFVLRGVSFIPGWINDLTTPDVAFTWTTSLPIFGTELHLLPLVFSALMFLQQKVSSSQNKANKDTLTDQQKQMQSVGKIMSVGAIFLMYNMASGVFLYLIFSTAFAILQQWYMTKRMQKSSQKDSVKIIKE